jgi:hypothetical protein
MRRTMCKKLCLAATLIVVSMTAVPATAEAAPGAPQVAHYPGSVICRIMPWMCR